MITRFRRESPCRVVTAVPVTAESLANDVAALGYAGFAYLRPRKWKAKNPGQILLTALAQEDLESRLVETLPWIVLKFWPLDQTWLVREAKLLDVQNRLGFVVSLARRRAEAADDQPRARALKDLEAVLERSRLAKEDTLCRASLPEAERRWLAQHRPPEARHWNLLTDWTADALRDFA